MPNLKKYLNKTMEWQRYIEKVHSTVRKDSITPKERTEKGYYEWIMKREDIRGQINCWLNSLNEEKQALKDKEKGKSLKEQGNVYFKKKDYPSSVKSYTESARYSLLENGDFSIAIANRSAAFFHMCRYKESLQDIELAISCNYPKESSWKLYLRAAQCHLKLRQGKLAEDALEKLEKTIENNNEITVAMKNMISKQAKDFALAASESQKRYEKLVKSLKTNTEMNPENMLEKNDVFPFASTALIRKRSPIRGRYVVAGKPIKKGDILFVEKPFAWVPVTHGNNVSLCAHCCGSMDDSLIPCRECPTALYCSSKCWNDAWSYHKWECPGYRMALWEQIGVSHLALKIFLITIKTSDRVWFNDVHKLLTNTDKKSPDDVLGLTIATLMVTNYMEKFTNFFDVVDLKECLIDKFDDKNLSLDVDVNTIEGKKLFVGSMILRHSLQMLGNAYAVTRIAESCEEPTRAVLIEEQQRIATGVYSSAAMLNHSCDPTVTHTFWKNVIIVKAVKDIPEGQEIFNCYGPYFKRMSKAERRRDLWSQYCFYCECEACANPLFDNYKERFDGLKCPKCFGSSLISSKGDSQLCYDCGAISDVNFVDSLKKADELSDRGMYLTDIEKWEEAIPYFEKSLAIRKKYLYKYNEDLAIVLDALGKCHASNGRWLTSISFLEQSFAAIEERYGSDSIEVANELNKITDVCLRYVRRTQSRRTDEYRKTFIKTRKYVDRAVAIMNLVTGPWNDSYRQVNDKKEQLSGLIEQLHI